MENKLTSHPDAGNIADQIANLSPAKLALLQLKLGKMGLPASCSQVIPRCAERESAQLSFAQQRLWILDRLEPNSLVAFRPKEKGGPRDRLPWCVIYREASMPRFDSVPVL